MIDLQQNILDAASQGMAERQAMRENGEIPQHWAWTYFDDHGEALIERETAKEAIEYAEELFRGYCDDNFSPGTTINEWDTVCLIDLETEEVVAEKPFKHSYEVLRSDWEEHNLHYRGGFV